MGTPVNWNPNSCHQLIYQSQQEREETPFDFNQHGHKVSSEFNCDWPQLISELKDCHDTTNMYLSAQEVLNHCQVVSDQEMFGDLWRDNLLQATSKVGRQTLQCLGLEPYLQALLKQGLKACGEGGPESNQVLDQAMEYAKVVGVEMLEMMVMMDCCIPG